MDKLKELRELEELSIEAHLKDMDKLTIQNLDAKRPETLRHVDGDPYAGFAKGPRDSP